MHWQQLKQTPLRFLGVVLSLLQIVVLTFTVVTYLVTVATLANDSECPSEYGLRW